MAIELLKYWEVAVDAVQILLCILILFFLIRNHRYKLKPGGMSPQSESGQGFNFQVFSQTINQQVEMAFNNILEVAASERRSLEKVLQLQQVGCSKPSPPVRLTSSSPYHGGDNARNVHETDSRDEHQTRIRQLATRGMNPKQISDKLKTPLGEVELVLSLQEE